MISYKYRFIYIRIAKCATSTLKSYFRRAASAVEIRSTFPIPIWLGKSGKISLSALYPNYFIFAFVRNPFDRFVSFFLHGSRSVRAVRGERFLHQSVFYNIWNDMDAKDARIIPPPYKSLEECAEQTQQGLWKIKEDQYIDQTKYAHPQLNFERIHSRLQAHYLLSRQLPTNKRKEGLDGSPCSFIGRIENFDQDLAALSSILGLPHRPVWKINVAEERNVAGGKRRHYSAYYTKRARRLVEEIYAKDLDLLGYEFEDETKTSVPVSLCDMDRLQERRKKEVSSRGRLGFKLFILRLYYPYREFIYKRWLCLMARLLLIVQRMPVLNYLYEKLYKPLKGWVMGKSLSRIVR